MKLSLEGLVAFPGAPAALEKPVEPSIIAHVGVGGFHRAHLAYILHQLAVHHNSDWRLVGVGLMPFDRAMYNALSAQDYLYTVRARGADRDSVEVVQSIIDYATVFVDDEKEASLQIEKLCTPNLKIISSTVTEKGYYLRKDQTAVDETNTLIQADIASFAPGRGCLKPQTLHGFVCTVIERRRTRGMPPLAVMSCDNLPLNGNTTQTAIHSFAKLACPALAEYLATEITFPNSMVDRITPVTTQEDIAMLASDHGIEDQWPVMCETFLQYVLEDDFPAGRPAFEKVPNVMVTASVEPYENMKLRLLNSSHSVLAYLATLLSYVYVHEAMADARLVGYLRQYMAQLSTTLDPVPGIDLAEYQETLIKRFANPHVLDTLARLCLDGSVKFVTTLQPALEILRKEGAPMPSQLALGLAGFLRYSAGVNDAGETITLADDPANEALKSVGVEAYTGDHTVAVRKFLVLLFGEELAQWSDLVEEVQRQYTALITKKVNSCMNQFA